MLPQSSLRQHVTKLACVIAIMVSCQTGLWAQAIDSDESDDLFLSKPNTPMRQVRGAILAERLERPDLAQGYLNDLLDNQPSIQTLMDLRREFGIGTFLKLSSSQDLQPASRELLRAINEASVQEKPSASSVELLIQEFGLSKQQTQNAALRILAAEDAAVVPLLNADPSTPQGQIAVRMLHKYARRFRYGLVAALPDSSDDQKLRILKLLAFTADPKFTLDLKKYRFSESAAVAQAATATVNRLKAGDSQPESRTDAADLLIHSSLDLIANVESRYPTASQQLTDRNLQRYLTTTNDGTPYGKASLARATALARDAVSIVPDEPRCIAALQVAEITEQSWPGKWSNTITKPTAELEIVAPEESSVLAMQMALKCNGTSAMLALLQTPAAIAVFKHHGDVRRGYLLSPDPRIRLLSAATAKACNDTGLYVRNAIQSASKGNALPEAVAIDSRTSESPKVAAVLATSRIDATATMVRIASGALASDGEIAAKLGVTVSELQEMRDDSSADFNRFYAATPAVSGRSGFVRATEQLNCEMILVHSNCLMWNLSDTIANLRADYRTSTTPIIIYGPERDDLSTQTVRSQHKGVWFLQEPMSEFTFSDRMSVYKIPGPLLTSEERKQMIAFAKSLR